jgi:hypothetical protein
MVYTYGYNVICCAEDNMQIGEQGLRSSGRYIDLHIYLHSSIFFEVIRSASSIKYDRFSYRSSLHGCVDFRLSRFGIKPICTTG